MRVNLPSNYELIFRIVGNYSARYKVSEIKFSGQMPEFESLKY